jgi:hypothetical protein
MSKIIELDLKPMLAAIEALQKAGYSAGVEDINQVYVVMQVLDSGRVVGHSKVLMLPEDVNKFLEETS